MGGPASSRPLRAREQQGGDGKNRAFRRAEAGSRCPCRFVEQSQRIRRGRKGTNGGGRAGCEGECEKEREEE
jgi:hypothetical protein